MRTRFRKQKSVSFGVSSFESKTAEEIAALDLSSMRHLSRQVVRQLNAEQLHAFTDAQLAVLSEDVRDLLEDCKRMAQMQQQVAQAEQRAMQAEQERQQAEQRAMQAEQQAAQAEQRATQAEQQVAVERALRLEAENKIREQFKSERQQAPPGTENVRAILANPDFGSVSTKKVLPIYGVADPETDNQAKSLTGVSKFPLVGGAKKLKPAEDDEGEASPDHVSLVETAKWTDAEFIEFLEAIDVDLLNVVMEKVPDGIIRRTLQGNPQPDRELRANTEAILEEILIKCKWLPLCEIFSSKAMELNVSGGADYLKVPAALNFAFRVDKFLELLVPAASPSERAAAKASLHDTVEETKWSVPVGSMLGAAIIEIKMDRKFPIAMPVRTSLPPDVMENVLAGNLADCMDVIAVDYNPVRQVCTYMLMYLVRFGVLTTFNRTVFATLDPNGTEISLSRGFHADEKHPFSSLGESSPASKWTMWEVWIRFILATLKAPRLVGIPVAVKHHFSEIINKKVDKPDDKDKDGAGSSANPAGLGGSGQGGGGGSGQGGGGNGNGRKSSSGSKGKSSGSGAPAMDSLCNDQAFTPTWADLWDHRRFAIPRIAPPEVEMSLEQLEGDARLIAKGRTGDIYRKHVHGRDAVFKVLKLLEVREELDGEEHVTPVKIRAELEHERDAYARLRALQGRAVAKFIWQGELAPGLIDALVTEYAGERLPDVVPPALVSSMLESLDAIHTAGVLHGDIAKRNCVVNDQSKVLFVDLAFAQFREDFESEQDWEEAVSHERALAEELMPPAHADVEIDDKTVVERLGDGKMETLASLRPQNKRRQSQADLSL